MAKTYDAQKIEEKWLKKWHESGIFNTNVHDSTKPKFYTLGMFPYPSAAALHMGHAFIYTGLDAYARFKRHMGYNVFEPMGFDAFGIHGENFAIKVNRHPADVLEENVIHFRKQMDSLGAMFDWSHSVNTTYPDYYKWTQWIFVQLYKAGLAERKVAQVNWCPSCKTVLSDEQVIQGECERCGSVTEKKDMLQWFFLITKYAQKLLDNHEKIDWPKTTIAIQRNWIGRSEGASILFAIENEKEEDLHESLEVFSTRPDTIYGATFIVVSIKHPILKRVSDGYYEKVDKYIKMAESQVAIETEKDKTGEFSGLYGINPLSKEKIPVFVANYVLSSYGTGALMGVPAHDERDFAFAQKYDLPITRVVASDTELPYEGEGILLDSGDYSGLQSADAREKIVKALEKAHQGSFQVNYKLRDWLVSRQRYWGPPIPIVYCDDCGTVPVEDLPVFLPNIEDFKPKGDGKSPLAEIDSFVNTTCPKCGGKARRETDVLDNFVDSSWYFLRYPSVGINDVPFDEKLTKKWLPVDMYIGGNEHAVLHLMYTRFIVMALHDLGYLDFDEPFHKFRAQGMIIKDGSKMSKSKGNIINPDDYITKYGADVLRMYILFIGPYSQGGDFSDKNILGIVRFIERIWVMKDFTTSRMDSLVDLSEIHELTNKISEDIDNLSFNTAIAALMEYMNWLYKHHEVLGKYDLFALQRNFTVMLSGFCPFISEEIWEFFGEKGFVTDAAWPKIMKVEKKTVTMPVQINGKVRSTMDVLIGTDEAQVLDEALKLDGVSKYLDNGSYKKVVFVKDKIINIII